MKKCQNCDKLVKNSCTLCLNCTQPKREADTVNIEICKSLINSLLNDKKILLRFDKIDISDSSINFYFK